MKNVELIKVSDVKSIMWGQDLQERYDFFRAFFPEYLTSKSVDVETVKGLKISGFKLLEVEATPENQQNEFETDLITAWNAFDTIHPEYVATLANIIARSEKVQLSRGDSILLAVHTYKLMMEFIRKMADGKDLKAGRVYLATKHSLVTPYVMLFYYGMSHELVDKKYNFRTFDDFINNEDVKKSIYEVNGSKEVRNHVALASGVANGILGVMITQGDMNESLEYIGHDLGEFDWNSILKEVQQASK